MSTRPICPVCESEKLAPGRTVCASCTKRLRHNLQDLPVLMEAATAAVGGRLRFGARVGSRSAETPVPVNLAASDAAYQARTTLLVWTDHVAQARRSPCRPCEGTGVAVTGEGTCRGCAGEGSIPERTPDTWAGIQRFLDVRAGWIAGQDAGPEAYRAILDALHAAARSVDRPPERHYAGPCTATTVDEDELPVECDGELYARPDKPEVQCPRCHATYPVADRRAWLLERAWDTVATGPDIVRALAGDSFQLHVHLSTLRRWASEGKLERVDTYNGRPRYRLGDVVALATGTTPARERMQA